MTSYISSILGAVILGIVIEVALPNGQTRKYIKGMYSIFVVFILLTPVANLVNKDFDLNELIDTTAVSVNEDYIEYITKARAEQMATYLEQKLDSEGMKNISIEVVYKETDLDISIEKIIVNIQNLVIDRKDKHINKYNVIKECILNSVKIEEGAISFNE